MNCCFWKDHVMAVKSPPFISTRILSSQMNCPFAWFLVDSAELEAGKSANPAPAVNPPAVVNPTGIDMQTAPDPSKLPIPTELLAKSQAAEISMAASLGTQTPVTLESNTGSAVSMAGLAACSLDMLRLPQRPACCCSPPQQHSSACSRPFSCACTFFLDFSYFLFSLTSVHERG